MPRRTLLIVNPRSRGGATGRRWERAAAGLRAALGPLDVEATRGPRDAERLAREAVRAGFERILVAGGDGTLSEVANGLLGAGLARSAQIGILPFGTGADFARTLGIPRELDGAVACVAAGRTRAADALRVSYHGDNGEARVSYGVNVASFGLAGLAARLVQSSRGPRLAGLAVRWGALRAMRRYRAAPVALRIDGELVYEGPLTLGAGANGRFFGGGMRIAPQARIDDGLLDLVIVSELSVARMLRELPSLYRGRHLAAAGVSLHRGRLVEARAAAGAVPLELDGEPLGALPARIEVVPGALELIGPAA